MNYLQSILCLDSTALEALERQVRPPVGRDSDGLAKLSAHVEIAATFSAVTASIANALADPRAPKVNVQALSTYAPSDLPAAFDTAEQMAWDGEDQDLAANLFEFQARLGLAKRMAHAFVNERADKSPNPSVAPDALADAWCNTCASALRLVHVISDVRKLAPEAAETQRFIALCQLLEEAKGPAYPCVETDGYVVVPGWAERRRQARYEINIPALIEFGPVSYEISIVDVSRGGLGIDGIQVLLAGDTVTVNLPDGRSLPARVAWVSGARAGLELADPLAPDDPLLRH